MRNRVTWLVIAAAFLTACGGSGSTAATSPSSTPLSGNIFVLAAASLTASFNGLGNSFQAAHPGVTVKFSFAGRLAGVVQDAGPRL